MKYQYLLIDGQNLFWRAFTLSIHKFITVDDHLICQYAVQKGFRLIEQLVQTFGYNKSEVYILFDNSESQLNIRKEIFEEYKSIRVKKHAPKGLYDSLKIFIHLLKYYSDYYFVGRVEGLEADDLTYPILKSLELSKRVKALVVSADLDWARNIEENINWYNYREEYTLDIFKEKYKFSPEGKSIQLYKAIRGDKSDSIPNAVPHLPEKILVDIVTTYKDDKDLFKQLWRSDYPTEWKQKIQEAEAQIRINFQLTDFFEIQNSFSDYIYKCKRSVSMLKFFYDMLDLPHETFMLNSESSEKDFFRKNNHLHR